MEFINKPIVGYVPHGINHREFYPISEEHPEYSKVLELRQRLFGDKDEKIKFVLFFNSRNIRRKMVPDIVLAYRTFVDFFVTNKEEVALLLHTQPVDDNGTDLYAVIENICPNRNVFFTNGLVDSNTLNVLYNVADVTVGIGSNEGWGLSMTESVMAGTPIIANVTGGLQDQMRFEDEEGNWIEFNKEFPSNHTGKYKKHGIWAIPVFPSNRSVQGSVPTPYIFDDRVAFEDLAVAMKKWYETQPTFREAAGELGRTWMCGDEAKMTSDALGKNMIKYIDHTLENWTPRKPFVLVDSKKYKYLPEHMGILIDENKLNYGK